MQPAFIRTIIDNEDGRKEFDSKKRMGGLHLAWLRSVSSTRISCYHVGFQRTGLRVQ